MDACSACPAPVRTMITEGGKIRDLNPDPTDDGNHIIVTTGTGHVRARVLAGTELPATGDAYRMHVCPPKPPPGPPCTICHLPMPRELARAENWRWHPCCDPDYRREAGLQAAARADTRPPRARKAKT